MALRTVDLTKQPYKAVFVGCSEDEINYAKTFWQSVQLLPPMESRLVSSDIKQRLRKAPHSRSMSSFTSHQTLSGASNLRDFFVRAKTMEHIEEFKRLHHFATARDEDREILHKHRDERIQKEKISHQIKPKSAISNLTSVSLYSAVSKEKEDDYDLSDDLSVDVKEEISNFEKVKGAIDDRDSDSN